MYAHTHIYTQVVKVLRDLSEKKELGGSCEGWKLPFSDI